ncbi:MAG TPA: hypothetical protein VJZ32_01205 [Candidatus Bathyarchaeia archaeon]|nr:hypothetical protein [Candidatus Bathyarchaeia archaeon]
MKTIQELGAVTYTHTYMLSLKALTSATILIMVVMAGLYVFLGLPPGLDTYYQILYFHSVGIGIAALAVFLVISIFDVQRYEPPIDFPIAYRAFAAVIFAAVGGIFYLSPILDAAVPDIPLGLYVVAFILIGDVGGALLVQLLLLPRKQAGTYKPRMKEFPPRMWPQYVLRMVPSRKEFSIYSKAGAAYWLVVLSVGSAFVAGLIGVVNLWIRIFGAGVFSGFVPQFGDVGTFVGTLSGSHSHEMGIAIITGVVAMVAQRFKVLDLKGLRKNAAKVGLLVTSIGIVAISIVLVLEAVIAFAPPTLFQGGPGGVNGMAGDDTTMAITALGAMIVLIPLALTKIDGKSSWKDSVRLALLGTWIAAVVNSVVEGFYIEFHEDIFGSTLATNHAVFSDVNPLFGIMTLLAVALVLLAVDYYEVGGILRRVTGWVAGVGIIVAILGASLYVFVDPSTGGLSYWLYILGMFVLGVSALAATRGIYTARISKISRTEI